MTSDEQKFLERAIELSREGMEGGKGGWGSDEGRNYSGSRIRVEVAVFVELHVLRLLQGELVQRGKRARKSYPTESFSQLVIFVQYRQKMRFYGGVRQSDPPLLLSGA